MILPLRSSNAANALAFYRLNRMLSKDTVESYRRMTPAERSRLTFQLQRESERYLLVGTPEQVKGNLSCSKNKNKMTREILRC